MASDAHCHPFDLAKRQAAGQDAEAVRPPCAASSWGAEDFLFNERLAGSGLDGGAPVALCFGCHPQLPARSGEKAAESVALLYRLCAEKRLDAIGECGFDLFDAAYRDSEAEQERIFALHLEAAVTHQLPLVLHIRRAMHTVFARIAALRQAPAVIFHSYSGTAGEMEALLRHGVNAYFSFGAAIVNNHKTAIRACAACPAEHILFETDAPYQPPRGSPYSRYRDLGTILGAAAAIRGAETKEAKEALERISDRTFNRLFFGNRSQQSYDETTV
jgi:TatD DNase family protein